MGLSKTQMKRVMQLGEARRGILMALGTPGIMSEQEGLIFRAIVDRIQDAASEIAGKAAESLLDSSPIQ